MEKCSGERKVIRDSVDGMVLSISHRCSVGHAGVWHSSSVLTKKRGQKVFVTSVLLSSAVLLTGNNFVKVELMAKMLKGVPLCQVLHLTEYKLFMLYQLSKSSGKK